MCTGGEKVRGFWKHYYSGPAAVVFVVNAASSDEQLLCSQRALIGASENHMLKGLPFLIVVNCTDQPGAKTVDEVGRCRPVTLEMFMLLLNGLIFLPFVDLHIFHFLYIRF